MKTAEHEHGSLCRPGNLPLLAVPLGCGGLEPTDPDQARETLAQVTGRLA